MLLKDSIRERHPEGAHHFIHSSFTCPQTSSFIHVTSPNTSCSTQFALHYFPHKPLDFCILSPDGLWICCLTCSVLTESRSLSMLMAKVHTGAPIKHPKSLQPLFIATDSEGFTVLARIFIHSFIFYRFILLGVAGGLEPIPASLGEAGYTLDKPPVHHRADI